MIGFTKKFRGLPPPPPRQPSPPSLLLRRPAPTFSPLLSVTIVCIGGTPEESAIFPSARSPLLPFPFPTLVYNGKQEGRVHAKYPPPPPSLMPWSALEFLRHAHTGRLQLEELRRPKMPLSGSHQRAIDYGSTHSPSHHSSVRSVRQGNNTGSSRRSIYPPSALTPAPAPVDERWEQLYWSASLLLSPLSFFLSPSPLPHHRLGLTASYGASITGSTRMKVGRCGSPSRCDCGLFSSLPFSPSFFYWTTRAEE